jgi:hypothetical protein
MKVVVLIAVAVSMILVIGITLTAAQKSQEVRSRAAEPKIQVPSITPRATAAPGRGVFPPVNPTE